MALDFIEKRSSKLKGVSDAVPEYKTKLPGKKTPKKATPKAAKVPETLSATEYEELGASAISKTSRPEPGKQGRERGS